MSQSTFDLYLELRQRFRISRELAVETLAWAEPLARKALGVHAQRDQMDLGEALQYLPVMTSAEDNGGWGELMPASITGPCRRLSGESGWSTWAKSITHRIY
jgi:hypothetical protein